MQTNAAIARIRRIAPLYRRTGLGLLLSLAPLATCHADLVSSPGGSIVANIATSGGTLVYSISRNGTPLVEISRLGATVNGTDLGSGVSITGGTSGSSTFGFFTPVFVHSGKAMTVLGAATTPGARIIQYTYNAGTNAQWEFRKP